VKALLDMLGEFQAALGMQRAEFGFGKRFFGVGLPSGIAGPFPASDGLL
jgi:hypothetical protein